MNTSQQFIKNFDKLTIDFNNFFEMLSKKNYRSFIKNINIHQDHVFKTTFSVKDVHDHKFFIYLMQKMVDTYKLHNVKLDADIYTSFLQGNTGTNHEDEYDVLLYNLHGETMYLVDKERFILEPGDLLYIKKGQLHQSITLRPRITFSLGIREDYK
tara:strand:+ start:42 stop:509 length:468 start_codon:yes stop_codon:yes gene_type:complete